MASSLSFSTTGNNGLPSCMALSSHSSDGCTYGQAMFSKKSKSRELSIVSVATDLPPIVLQPPWKEVTKVQKLVAWTSVREERWEGKLVVEGEIPQWLVCLCVCVCRTMCQILNHDA